MSPGIDPDYVDGKQKKLAYNKAYYLANREQVRAQQAEYYAANRELIKSRSRKWRVTNAEDYQRSRAAWRERNRDKDAESSRRWFAENRERARATRQAWADANRDKVREYARKSEALPERRIRKRERWARRDALMRASLSVPVNYEKILLRDGYWCYLCESPVPPGNQHFDHVVPISRGGSHVEENIRVTHARCNMAKGARLLKELVR